MGGSKGQNDAKLSQKRHNQAKWLPGMDGEPEVAFWAQKTLSVNESSGLEPNEMTQILASAFRVARVLTARVGVFGMVGSKL